MIDDNQKLWQPHKTNTRGKNFDGPFVTTKRCWIIYFRRNRDDKYCSDNSRRPRQKRRYEHRRTKRRNSELRVRTFYPTINCYHSTRSSLLSSQDENAKLTIIALELTCRWWTYTSRMTSVQLSGPLPISDSFVLTFNTAHDTCTSDRK